MPLEHMAQQVDELLAVDVVACQPQVKVFLVVGAVRPEYVQPLPPAAHADQETLPDQQPAGEDQVKPPDRVARIHEIPSGGSPLPPGLGLLPPVLVEELFLLVRVGLPQEASDLVVTDADAIEQILYAAGLVRHAEGVVNPLANLIGVAEAAGADLIFESLDLVGGELARVPLVVEGAEGVEPLVAIDAQPFTQLGQTHAQQ